MPNRGQSKVAGFHSFVETSQITYGNDKLCLIRTRN